MNYPMAKLYLDGKHGRDLTLRVTGIEAIQRDERLKQMQTYSTSHPGLNEDFHLSPFL